MEKVLEYTVSGEDLPCSVGQILKVRLGISEREIRSAKFKDNGILVNGKRARVTQQAQVRDRIRILLEGREEGSLHLRAVKGTVDILYEDADIVLVNKPPGLPVHPGHGHYSDTLANYLVSYYREQGQEICIRAVGRLDKDTSGVVVFAKNRLAAARLTKNSPEKEYRALVQGHLKEWTGCIDRPLAKKAGALNQMQTSAAGRRAVTHYQVIGEYRMNCPQDLGYSLVSLTLETGRTHQIRVHMASIGHPLLGDGVYGSAGGKCLMERTALHCHRVKIIQPFTGEKIDAAAPVPDDMQRLIEMDSGKEREIMERLNYEVGDVVRLKKPHPCGSSEWEILRVGADFRLKCQGCGHQIMVARKLVEKNTKELKKK